ncbi:envelope stress response membrane protein PspC [Altererythrobacter indicus]|uniref:Envelope stress response membrane protein PspC n=1 Tax=Altericroceibacterium indicum TaxID=374177 RepID=A0A845AAI5_9SPHN|nr:envelope stress response membrane protein PspC [Altericroceibacterium indicum]MXP25556.1 envelope stress response membrane protein PspC [Altericroceibacterium indicum]
MSSQRTKFYRDKQNSKLMGVCSGLSDYTGIEAIWWRLGFIVLTLSTGFGLPIYFVLGLLADKKPAHLYTDRDEQKYWQRVRQSPKRTAREVRSRFRDIDRRLADVEQHYVSSNPRLSAEIENLR